jgi:hypothetical protein
MQRKSPSREPTHKIVLSSCRNSILAELSLQLASVEIDAGDANPLDVKLSIPHPPPQMNQFYTKNVSTNIRVSGGIIYLISVTAWLLPLLHISIF